MVISSPAVPVAIIRAAGLKPWIVRGSPRPTPLADRQVEPDVFPSRILQLFEAALRGDLADVAAVVVPRTSDADYKAFLYLREFSRAGIARIAPVSLFDLLQSRGALSEQYDRARVQALAEQLGASAPALAAEVARHDAVRAAAKRLLAMRRPTPQVSGAEIFPWLVKSGEDDPTHYVEAASALVADLRTRPPLPGPRVLLAGAPVDGPELHIAIEALGAVVVGELSAWSTGMSAPHTGADEIAHPVLALATACRTEFLGPRLPATDLRAWFDEALAGIDAVVFSLPPDDAVFGWDYPAWRAALEARGLPHACLHGDPYQPLSEADAEALATLLQAAERTRRSRPQAPSESRRG